MQTNGIEMWPCTLNIEQAIETLSESSIRTWDVKIVEFFVQRIKSSNGTNSYNAKYSSNSRTLIILYTNQAQYGADI